VLFDRRRSSRAPVPGGDPDDTGLDRRTFVRAVGAGPVLVGLGAGPRLVPDAGSIPTAGVPQAQPGGEGLGDAATAGTPDVRSSVATLVEGIVADSFDTYRPYVGVGVVARCPHGTDQEIETEVADPYSYPDGPDDTKLVVGENVFVPAPAVEPPRAADIHAHAGAGMAYEKSEAKASPVRAGMKPTNSIQPPPTA
jgi:hypothetical protein